MDTSTVVLHSASVKDWAEVYNNVITGSAILVAGIVAIIRFRLYRVFRELEQSVTIDLHISHAWQEDELTLYTNVEIENIGVSEIRGRKCLVRVEPLIGAQPYSAEILAEVKGMGGEDPASLFVIDKGEHSSFALAVPVPSRTDGLRPTACAIRVEYYCDRQLERAQLGWMVERAYVLRETHQAATPASRVDKTG